MWTVAQRASTVSHSKAVSPRVGRMACSIVQRSSRQRSLCVAGCGSGEPRNPTHATTSHATSNTQIACAACCSTSCTRSLPAASPAPTTPSSARPLAPLSFPRAEKTKISKRTMQRASSHSAWHWADRSAPS
eukprot:2920385-Rhodomonas_salina.1